MKKFTKEENGSNILADWKQIFGNNSNLDI